MRAETPNLLENLLDLKLSDFDPARTGSQSYTRYPRYRKESDSVRCAGYGLVDLRSCCSSGDAPIPTGTSVWKLERPVRVAMG